MNILALETSTEACSVAILDRHGVIFSEFKITPRQHTQYLPLMMDAVMKQAQLNKTDLTHISYASGPGAFTGVRIAASTAQGLSIGLNLPLVPISTLAVLAQHALDMHKVDNILATLDARMGEAYVAQYKKNPETRLVELEGEEKLIKLEQLDNPPDYFLAGPGFRAKREAGFGSYEKMLDEEILPHAAALAALAKQAVQCGKVVSADTASINYIRNRVAEKKKLINV